MTSPYFTVVESHCEQISKAVDTAWVSFYDKSNFTVFSIHRWRYKLPTLRFIAKIERSISLENGPILGKVLFSLDTFHEYKLK